MTFDPSHVLPWAWQEVDCEAVSFDEVDYHLKFAGSRAERRVARTWSWLCCSAHTGNKVSCGVGGVVQWP